VPIWGFIKFLTIFTIFPQIEKTAYTSNGKESAKHSNRHNIISAKDMTHFCTYGRVFGVGESKYAMQNFEETKALFSPKSRKLPILAILCKKSS